MGQIGRDHSGSSDPTSLLKQVIALCSIHGKLCSTFCPHTEFAMDLIAVLHKKDKNNLVHGIRSHEFNVKTEKNQYVIQARLSSSVYKCSFHMPSRALCMLIYSKLISSTGKYFTELKSSLIVCTHKYRNGTRTILMQK